MKRINDNNSNTNSNQKNNNIKELISLYNKNIGYTLGLFFLYVAVKLKPDIVSQGELIVNLRRNCRVRLERQTTI